MKEAVTRFNGLCDNIATSLRNTERASGRFFKPVNGNYC